MQDVQYTEVSLLSLYKNNMKRNFNLSSMIAPFDAFEILYIFEIIMENQAFVPMEP